jgi:hypothetical protein
LLSKSPLRTKANKAIAMMSIRNKDLSLIFDKTAIFLSC